ncbi:MAG TPA: ammonia-forming cytochrome c nitrite reductase subunit c552, partial [Candidatus Deferrimicrobiaceae bacterium]
GVANRPSGMFIANVDCVGCHLVPKMAESTVPFLGQTFKASETACLGCHGEDYKGVLGEWEDTLKKELEKTRPVVEKVRGLARTADPSNKELRKAVQAARDAEYNYLLVLYGKGVHNVDYAMDVLGKARADAEAATAVLTGTTASGKP